MRIYLLRTCDTCRKALAELRKAGHAPEVVEIREDGIGRDDIVRFHAAFGEALVNRRSRTWRELEPTAREADVVDLVAAHPTVMKRPVIDTGADLHLGWSRDVAAAIL